MPCPSHPRLDHFNYTCRRVQIMKLLVTQFSPPSCHLIPLRSKYPPQHPVLKHPQSMFAPFSKTKIVSIPLINAELFSQNMRSFCWMWIGNVFVDRSRYLHVAFSLKVIKLNHPKFYRRVHQTRWTRSVREWTYVRINHSTPLALDECREEIWTETFLRLTPL
jgi:hypothetical protein